MSGTLVALVAYLKVVHALPITPPAEISDTCNTIKGCRTLQSIIFTCVGTIYLCTWVSLHIDVPNPRVPSILKPFGRLLTFIIMIITPELWAHLAFQQRLGAQKWAAKYKDWTMRHGFLAVMGGFALRTGPTHYERLTSGQLEALLDDKKIEVPQVPLDHIEDRSKTTALAKTVLLFQTGWFVVQLIARRIDGLPIIPLEVFTLAFGIVTFALYVCNWYKPYEMRTPFIVELVPDDCSKEPQDSEGSDEQGTEDAIDEAVTTLEQLPNQPVQSTSEYNRAHALLSDPKYRIQYTGLPRILRLKFLEPLRRLGYTISDFLGLFDPDYLWYHTHPTVGMRVLSALLVVIVCAAFGAIHFLAWDLTFPSALCQEIWQICTIASMGIPLLGLVSIALFARVRDALILGELRMIIDTALVLVYGACRIILLLLTIWSLLYVPQGAYKAINWTTFAPHI